VTPYHPQGLHAAFRTDTIAAVNPRSLSTRAALVAAALSSALACAPVRTRPALPEVVAETERIRFRAPGGAEWHVRPEVDANGHVFAFTHFAGDPRWDVFVSVSESARAAGKPMTRARVMELLAARVRSDVGDPAAEVLEAPTSPEPRFGPDAIEVQLTARSPRAPGASASATGISFVHADRIFLVLLCERRSPARSAAEVADLRALVLERLSLKSPPRSSRASPGRASRHQIRRVR
jgi:hypothetical protein